MYFAKWVLPPVGFGSVAVYMFWKESQKAKPEFLILSLVLAFAAIIFIVVFKRRMWTLADEVLDGGTYLLVRFGTKEASINLSNITRVDSESQLGATTVRLRLATPCEFGSAISFLAKSTSRNPFALNGIAEDLIARVQGGSDDGRSNNRWRGP
jgi:hypothetical protein